MTEEERRLSVRRAQIAALQEQARTGRPKWTENVWGRGEADTPGERLGQTINDMGRAVGSGIVRGTTGLLDLPGKVVAGAGNVAASALEKAGAPGMAIGMRDAMTQTPFGSGNTIGAGVDMVAPGVRGYTPQTTAGEYAQTIGEFIPGGALGKGPMIASALAPGLMSEAAGQMTEDITIPQGVPLVGGQPLEPYARVAGALLGPAAYNTARNAITPNPADPARIAMDDRLRAEGVHTTAGQRTGNVPLRNREEYLHRTQQILANQGDEFTSAAMKRVGETGRAEPEVMRATIKRLGDQFDDLAARNQITPDATLKSGADDALAAFADVTDAAPPQVIRDVAARIDDAVSSGAPITGDVYQDLRTRLGKATTSTDAPLRGVAVALKDALDDAMGRSIQATGNVDDLTAWQSARQQYRDFLAIERAATSAGADTALGVINPRQLRTATVSQGRREVATGGRDLGELARAGNAIMAPVPNSGTPGRLEAMLRGATSLAPTGAGAIIGHSLSGGNPAITAASTIAGLLAPAARNAFTGSRVGQAYLGNQIAAKLPKAGVGDIGKIVASLLAQR